MNSSFWRNETEGRLRKAQVSLEAARSLIARKPPCNDDAVNRASAAALQAARALVDARWPPRDEPPDPYFRPGMTPLSPTGPFTRASWPVIIAQFEKASSEMALPFDATEYLRTLIEDGAQADIGEAVYEPDEAVEAVETAEKLVTSVTSMLGLAFSLGYRELDEMIAGRHHDENATTLEVAPLEPPEPPASFDVTEPGMPALVFPIDLTPLPVPMPPPPVPEAELPKQAAPPPAVPAAPVEAAKDAAPAAAEPTKDAAPKAEDAPAVSPAPAAAEPTKAEAPAPPPEKPPAGG